MKRVIVIRNRHLNPDYDYDYECDYDPDLGGKPRFRRGAILSA